jgi:hypothetical protein
MNLVKNLFLVFFLFQFMLIGFSETILIDGVEVVVQDTIEVVELYDDTKNWFIFMLITGFTGIIAVTMGLVMREINIAKKNIK